MPGDIPERDRPSDVWRQTQTFRRRLRRVLAGQGAAVGASLGAWAAGLLILAGRLIGVPATSAHGLLFLLGLSGLAACVAGAAATRRTPAHAACIAALDASSAAGGRIMCHGMPGAEAWPVAVSRLPAVCWHGQRAWMNLAFAVFFALPAALLPARFVTGRIPARVSTVDALVAQIAARVEQAEAEALLAEPVIAVMSNQLAQIGQSGDAADPARTLEALDHIGEELERTATAQAEALAEEQAALQAAMAFGWQLSDRLDALAASGSASEAAQALAEYFAQARLPDALSSNLMACCAGTNGLNAATLAQINRLLREAGVCNEARLMRLSDLKLVDASICRIGSCTNAQACAAALAHLLDSRDPAADAAACLAALCAGPGAGCVSRGRADAPLTWSDPAVREDATFKEETLTPAGLPAFNQARLEGVSAAAPDVPAHAVATAAGALGDGVQPQGISPQAPILPRHRETVSRFFDNPQGHTP